MFSTGEGEQNVVHERTSAFGIGYAVATPKVSEDFAAGFEGVDGRSKRPAPTREGGEDVRLQDVGLRRRSCACSELLHDDGAQVHMWSRTRKKRIERGFLLGMVERIDVDVGIQRVARHRVRRAPRPELAARIDIDDPAGVTNPAHAVHQLAPQRDGVERRIHCFRFRSNP